MLINRIEVSNFRSIQHAEIDLRPLNIIVGANAAGKSNLINVFRFIRDIMALGVDNAIALQGGIGYLANVRSPKGTPIKIEFSMVFSEDTSIVNTTVPAKYKRYISTTNEINYRFSIIPYKKGTGYNIGEDYISIKKHIKKVQGKEDGTSAVIEEGTYTIVLSKNPGQSTYKKEITVSDAIKNSVDLKKQVDNENPEYLIPSFVRRDKKELMLSGAILFLPMNYWSDSAIRIYDFDPKELKRPSAVASVSVLSEDGANIANVLNAVLRKKESKDRLTLLLKRFLPYVNSISVESNMDKSFAYKINEKYSKRSFHAGFLSDGTVSMLAIIIALYFETRSGIIVLEEPERNIHPKLLPAIISSAEDVSQEKQVVITTHNPVLLKHAKLEDIKFVTRDDCGDTIITEPQSNSTVKLFIENDLGLDDLFIQDLLR